MTNEELRIVIDEWRTRDHGIMTISDAIATANPETAEDWQVRATRRLLDSLYAGAHAIECGAEFAAVRSIFKTFAGAVVGYDAPGEASRRHREQQYDMVIGVIDEMLSAADARREHDR